MSNDKTVEEVSSGIVKSYIVMATDDGGNDLRYLSGDWEQLIIDIEKALTTERSRAEETKNNMDFYKAACDKYHEIEMALKSRLKEAEKDVEQYRQVTYGERELPDADLKQDQAYLAFNLAIMSKGARDNAKKVKELESKLHAQDELIGKCREALEKIKSEADVYCSCRCQEMCNCYAGATNSIELISEEALKEFDKVMGESK